MLADLFGRNGIAGAGVARGGSLFGRNGVLWSGLDSAAVDIFRCMAAESVMPEVPF